MVVASERGITRFAGEPGWSFRDWQVMCASTQVRRACRRWAVADDRLPPGGPAAIMAELTDVSSGWEPTNQILAALRDVGEPDAYKIVARSMIPRLALAASGVWALWGRSLSSWDSFDEFLEEWIIQAYAWVPRVAQRRFEQSEFLSRAVIIDVQRDVNRAARRNQLCVSREVTEVPDGVVFDRECESAEEAYEASFGRCADLADWIADQTDIGLGDARVLVVSRVLGVPLTHLAGVNPRSVGRQRARNEKKIRDSCLAFVE